MCTIKPARKEQCFAFSLLAVVSFQVAFSQTVTPQIKINQLGFYSGAPKVGIVTGATAASKFYILSTNLRDTAYSGNLGQERSSGNSATKTRLVDFSPLKARGSFVVLVPGIGSSYVFEVGDAVAKVPAVACLKGYYYQRASMPLEERYAGKWHRSAGHPDNAVLVHASAATKERPEGTVISTPSGWYDAGDYNKYIVNSGITMGTLLSAYEDFPGYFKNLSTNIPESNNAVPDILDEAVYNLRWMLTMQDPNDGGVYNKCTNAAFDGMVMPGVTKAPRYVVQKGTAATLDFAAVTAQSSRILKEFKKELPGLADSCLTAAKKAWAWALLHPNLEYNQSAMNQAFKPVISTGGYGDRNFGDEWAWAATELYITTKDESFYEVFTKYISDNVNLPGWNSVGMMACYSILHFRNTFSASADDLQKMQDRLLGLANNYVEKISANAFHTVMGSSPRDFGWGSNSVAANQGMLLVKVYLLTGDKKYVDAALTNLDYLLGRNATGYCFVTGLGSKPPMFPHHRQSTADGVVEPVPGLLAGGPNPGMQDHCKYEFTEPETAYVDSDCAYASNEIAINWNAPMVYLANAIEALKTKVGYAVKK
jgi:endoglucanase